MEDILNAWISPTGRFVNCNDVGHEDWAEEYFKQKYGENAFNEKNRIAGHLKNYTCALHKLRWIRISAGYLVTALGHASPIQLKSLNKKQEVTIMNWCLENGLNPKEYIFY